MRSMFTQSVDLGIEQDRSLAMDPHQRFKIICSSYCRLVQHSIASFDLHVKPADARPYKPTCKDTCVLTNFFWGIDFLQVLSFILAARYVIR